MHSINHPELQDAFTAFDKEKKGYIVPSDLGLIMRSLGIAFKPLELHRIMMYYSTKGTCIPMY